MSQDRLYEQWKQQRTDIGSPEGFDSRIMASIQTDRPTVMRRRWQPVFAYAAAVLLGLAVGIGRWALAMATGLNS